MINPESINLRTLNIDSRLRKQGRAEDLEYELQEPVEMPRGSCFWVTNISLPVVWPNVNNNTEVHLKEFTAAGETSKIVNVAKGNYNLSGLASALQTALNQSTPFEQKVTYGASIHGDELRLGLLWKGHETRLDYTGAYESTLEQSYELGGILGIGAAR